VVAERKSENVYPKIPERIADPINPFASRVTQPETSAGHAVVFERRLNFLDRFRRHAQIRVEKPQDSAGRNLGAGIHLRGPSARRPEDAVRERARHRHSLVRASSIDDDDFDGGAETFQVTQKGTDECSLVQDRHDDGNKWRLRFRRHGRTIQPNRA